jgi:hypothetical protein
MKTASNIALRIVATFAASALSVIGAGAVAGVPLWKAFFMARSSRSCHCYRGLV